MGGGGPVAVSDAWTGGGFSGSQWRSGTPTNAATQTEHGNILGATPAQTKCPPGNPERAVKQE